MNPLDPLSSATPSMAGAAAVDGQAAAGSVFLDPPASVRSSISDLGRALSQVASRNASNASDRDQDIDDSDLPDAVKNLLRMIRDLRERLAELARELQAVQTDEGMDPELRRARLLRIRAQMGTLNGALVAATQKLSSLMREMKLDKSQQMTAAQLALR
ncbi:hypothetical protein [Castellaniella denitrificans]|uniref:hypothetical protein n=1 Tax=Castellaniella denitrificans TaxID=56119 RepID=UPI003614CC82